ncbi:MAG: DNA polymerase IV, partial [Pauljensenia sp.]|nr:DNA polymerase IV [Pauljensenia sp.]
RLFGVRVEGLQSRSDGVAVTLDRDEKPAASERAMDQIRSKFGAGALAPATLLGTQVPARRSFGGDAAQDGQGSRSAEASARQGGDARGRGEQGTLL